jgi:hypothetical protein
MVLLSQKIPTGKRLLKSPFFAIMVETKYFFSKKFQAT